MKIMKLSCRKAFQDELKEQEEKFAEVGNPDFDALSRFESAMKKRIDQVGDTLKESVSKQIEANNLEMEKKLNFVLAQNKSYSDSVKNIQTSTGAAIPNTGATDFRSIMKETRNAELAEESEKKRRVCNFIIHGVDEKNDTDKNENKKQDEDYVHTHL